jgi:hypothetical protein
MDNKDKYIVVDFDFASLYPTSMKFYDIEKLLRGDKIKRLKKMINDKRIDKELSSES